MGPTAPVRDSAGGCTCLGHKDEAGCLGASSHTTPRSCGTYGSGCFRSWNVAFNWFKPRLPSTMGCAIPFAGDTHLLQKNVVHPDFAPPVLLLLVSLGLCSYEQMAMNRNQEETTG